MIQAGATIGIIGGGQLGRMLAQAATKMGYQSCIFTPDTNSPAGQVAEKEMVAAYDDEQALKKFAQSVDVVTFEFENIPPESLELLQAHVSVLPKPDVLKVCRNRLREKEMINAQGLKTAPFAAVRSLEELEEALHTIGVPSVLKTTELGYDGKGQFKLNSLDDSLMAWQALKTDEAVLEGWIGFEREISIIVARNAQGQMSTFEPAYNIHENHILATSTVPAGVPDATIAEAIHIARTLAEAMELVGIMAVELFVTTNGLLVNELAPRPHNSGHWTIEAAATSQFEQHIRAICGMELGETQTLCPVEMVNLIGEDVNDLDAYRSNRNAHIHLYGKSEARTGRKMGHVTITTPTE